jgi:hypothetical protein
MQVLLALGAEPDNVPSGWDYLCCDLSNATTGFAAAADSALNLTELSRAHAHLANALTAGGAR